MRCATAIALTALLTACGSSSEETHVVRPVRTMTVHASTSTDQRIFAGVSKAGTESRLSFRVPGSIIELPVKVGDKVLEGDIIAKMDTHDFVLQLQAAEAALEQAKAMERQAVSQYNRVADLYETESASRSELDAARAQQESAKASRQAATNRMNLAQNQLDYAILKAPKEGDIASVLVETNENIASGQPVVVLNSGDIAEITISLPETLISQIRSGESVSVTFDAIPKQVFPGVVTEVAVARQNAPAFPVRVQLLRKSNAIRSGMSAQVQFNFNKHQDANVIIVPAYVVAEFSGEEFVYLAHPDADGFATIQKQLVKVGGFSGDNLKILNGLKDGDIIVSAGIQFLKDKQKVRLQADKK